MKQLHPGPTSRTTLAVWCGTSIGPRRPRLSLGGSALSAPYGPFR